MVAPANKFSYAAGRHLGVFLSQIHRHLARHNQVALAAFAAHGRHANVEMIAHLLQNVVYGKWRIVYLHSPFNHPFGQPHVDVAVIHHRISHQTVDNPFQVAHTSVSRFGNKLRNFGRYFQSIAAYFGVQYVYTELFIGLFQFGNDATRETGDKPIAHVVQFNGWAIASQDDAFAVAKEVVEDVEKRFLGFFCTGPRLHIINNKHVDGLVELDEIVGGVLQNSVNKLQLKEVCADVQHPFLGV